jgi:hypothetical protein
MPEDTKNTENTKLSPKEEDTRQKYYAYVGGVAASVILLGVTYCGYRWWRSD